MEWLPDAFLDTLGWLPWKPVRTLEMAVNQSRPDILELNI